MSRFVSRLEELGWKHARLQCCRCGSEERLAGFLKPSAIGSPGLISVLQLLRRPTTTVCGDSTKDMAAMQSDENDGNAQDEKLSHCVQLY
jgi:hypothetical protein